MKRVGEAFAEIRANGIELVALNADALAPQTREAACAALESRRLPDGSGPVRLLLHSLAMGNLKLLAHPPERRLAQRAVEAVAAELEAAPPQLAEAFRRAFSAGCAGLYPVASQPQYSTALLDEEDFALTIAAMGTSLLVWARALLDCHLFASDARIIGLTSEGSQVAWRGYAAVAAAKAVLESLVRAMALELAPYGIRTNAVQAGIADTPASRKIPGIDALQAQAALRNPFGRLTRPEDVADVVYLLATDEAAWINGAVIRADGGEHVCAGAPA